MATRETGRRPGQGQNKEQTAPAAESRRGGQGARGGAEVALARALGWFSVGLGLTELLAPRRVASLIGVRPRPVLLRLLGIRELASGLGILSMRHPAGALWSRVAGDAMDLALLGLASTRPDNDRERLLRATTSVLGVTALDLYGAARLSARDGTGGKIKVVESAAINRDPAECYAAWRRLENLPSFMTRIESVREIDGTHSHWVARVLGRHLEWDAEITRDDPGSLIAWRSLQGGDLGSEGVVEFQERIKGGAIVRVAIELVPPAGALGALVARFAGDDPAAQLKADLRRFKQLLETGEIATVNGQTSGKRTPGHGVLATFFNGGAL